jgi:hypothetical protein
MLEVKMGTPARILGFSVVIMVGLLICTGFAGGVAYMFWRSPETELKKPVAGQPKKPPPEEKDPLAEFKTPTKSLRVLFVGNSHTATNDLPLLVTKLAEAGNVERPLQAWAHAPGGTSFRNHWEQGDVQKLLGQVKWDLVVLQDQSAMPNFSRAERDRETFPFARKLNEKIKESGARTVLFMTWGYKDFFFPMQMQAKTAYRDLADDLNADLIPVGTAWEKAHRDRPNLELWMGDGNHATMHGSYLSACVFYTAFYGRSPVGNTYTAGLADADVRFLQTSAAAVVKTQPGGLATKATPRKK